jgi:uncharacterized membrane protein YeaQ/YmgE (transglycosylase-associated protein family)
LYRKKQQKFRTKKERYFMIGFLVSLVVGGLIGFIAEQIMNRDVPGGILGNIILGFLGSWLGGMLLGEWGWVIGGFAVFPAIIGAVVLVFLFSWIAGKTR